MEWGIARMNEYNSALPIRQEDRAVQRSLVGWTESDLQHLPGKAKSLRRRGFPKRKKSDS